MAERDQFDRLNDAIDDLIARRAAPSIDPELATLLLVAADLRDLPDPAFKARLRLELFKEDVMQTITIVNSVRPYLVVDGAAALLRFLEKTFDAEIGVRVPTPAGKVMHAEVRVGDSTIEMGDAPSPSDVAAVPLHVYVDDVDAVYRRALDAGAASLYAPVDQSYGSREAGFTDPLGGEWFVGSRLTGETRPERTVVPAIRAREASRLIAFLRDAFGIEEISRDTSPAGQIVYAHLRAGDGDIEVSDAHGKWPATKGTFHLFVDDPDAAYEAALRLGATSIQTPERKPYGERSAAVADGFGNRWFVARRDEQV